MNVLSSRKIYANLLAFVFTEIPLGPYRLPENLALPLMQQRSIQEGHRIALIHRLVPPIFVHELASPNRATRSVSLPT